MINKTIKFLFPFAIMAIFILLSSSYMKDGRSNPADTVKDIDGNVYHTVTIGTQVWMVENLKVTKYRNGKPIPNVTDMSVWMNLKTGAYCDYKNAATNSPTYGRLYNWYAITDSSNIAPTGWHVPTDAEWTKLVKFLGGDNVAGGKLKAIGLTQWSDPNTGASNIKGFTALPGGYRSPEGVFNFLHYYSFWWSSTEASPIKACFRSLDYSNANVVSTIDDKLYGLSVRCIKDK
jgi:uncharacterized protein (TIGR02145 family)